MISDQNEMASMGDRSFDPDTEPRKEGTIKMKHSPSIAEINEVTSAEGQTPGHKKHERVGGSLTKSPRGIQMTEIEEDENNYRSLNSDNRLHMNKVGSKK